MFTPDAYPTLDEILIPAPSRGGLGLDVEDLEAGIVAVIDRDDFEADLDTRARLARVRHALEAEVARMLAE